MQQGLSMSSLKSKVVIFGIRNRQLFRFPFKREVITRDTPTDRLRKQYEAGARRFGSIPAGIMLAANFVQSAGIGALLYDYRLAPECPFPAADHGGS
jgi:hypothetical protein